MADAKSVNGNAWQEVRVSLGPDAEVTGKLSFTVPTRIEGKLKGEVRATDLLVVGPQAIVHASVQAEKLIVLGEIRGEVRQASRVEICTGGRLFGDVEMPDRSGGRHVRRELADGSAARCPPDRSLRRVSPCWLLR